VALQLPTWDAAYDTVKLWFPEVNGLYDYAYVIHVNRVFPSPDNCTTRHVWMLVLLHVRHADRLAAQVQLISDTLTYLSACRFVALSARHHISGTQQALCCDGERRQQRSQVAAHAFFYFSFLFILLALQLHAASLSQRLQVLPWSGMGVHLLPRVHCDHGQ
jgi:hypothetical protein